MAVVGVLAKAILPNVVRSHLVSSPNIVELNSFCLSSNFVSANIVELAEIDSSCLLSYFPPVAHQIKNC